jgi:flagellar hook protein FlgE
MQRSLFAGISGLNAHQLMIDVAANNIANVNTVGYKSSSVVFEDTLSQTLAGAGQAGGPVGGTNPIQIGMGVKLAATNLDFTEGAPEATGVATNLMINGDGFFIVQKNGVQMFTRAGEFTRDTLGHLVTSDGSILCDDTGAPIDISVLDTGGYVTYSIDKGGAINAVDASGATSQIGQVGLATFSNAQGLQKVGNNNYIQSAASGTPTLGTPGSGSRGDLSAGYLEGSNVDLAKELTTLIVAERGFQANSKSITTSDEVLQTLVNLKQ